MGHTLSGGAQQKDNGQHQQVVVKKLCPGRYKELTLHQEGGQNLELSRETVGSPSLETLKKVNKKKSSTTKCNFKIGPVFELG